MSKASYGDTVEIHVEVKLEDETLIYSTPNRDPLKFTVGEGKLIPGLEEAVIGMEIGEKKKIILSPEEAYGPHNKELVHIMERSGFPPEINLEVGKRLRVRTKDGKHIIVTIKDFTEDSIVLDENDPLAGKTLTFNIELVEII